MRKQHPMLVDIHDADPTDAINAFLHNMNRQRSLGLAPKTEHVLAEHLFRSEVKIVYYSSAAGIISLVESGDIDPDDALETIMFLTERRKKRRQHAKACQAVGAFACEIEALALVPTP